MHKNDQLHENFDRDEDIIPPSDRRFGLVMGTVFSLLALFLTFHDHEWKAIFFIGMAFVFFVCAVRCPEKLSKLNHAWMRFGLLLHRVTNPVIMLLIYLLAIAPVGLIMKCLGKDPLRRKWDVAVESYWIVREPGPKPETMKQQF